MANNYSIRIVNNSHSDETYYLFQGPPESSFSKEIFTNIYGKSPIIEGDGNSSAKFEITSKYFAIYGTPPSAGLAVGTKISSSSHADVQLGEGEKEGTSWLLTTSHDSPKWVQPPSFIKEQGGFVIETDHSFKFPSKYRWFLGVGAQDPFNSSAIIPVATVTAKPGAKYTFKPKATYYICTGDYEQGTVIDIHEIGTKLEVNFTEEHFPDIAFEHTSNGSYKRLVSSN